MLKAKIGQTLCLLSAVLAATVFFIAINSDFASSFVTYQELRFYGEYYILLAALDIIAMLKVFLKAHFMASDDEPDAFGRMVSSKISAAVTWILYILLNALFALKLRALYDDIEIVALMLTKNLFFAAIYALLTAFAFARNRRLPVIIILLGIPALAFVMNLSLNQMIKTRGMDINLLINVFLSGKGREWPESKYWMTNALIVAAECALPTVRLAGLALMSAKEGKIK